MNAPNPESSPLKTRARGLERSFEILDYLCSTGKPQRPIEIATGMGAPKSSIYELIAALKSVGVLETTDDQGSVFLGRKLHYWSLSYLKHFDLSRLALPVLEKITARTHETSQLCMLDGDKYFVAMTQVGTRPYRISTDIGERLPIPWTASGRLLLGNLSEQEIIDLIPEEDFKLPNGTYFDPDAFVGLTQQAWQDQFCSQESVTDNFIRCLAVPVVDDTGACLCTLCVVAPKEDGLAKFEEYRQVLTEAGQELSERLQGSPLRPQRR